MSFVIDCSMALSWMFTDESTPATDRLFDRASAAGAVVPSLWRLEVANGLEMAVRRGRITAAFRELSLADLRWLSIEIDSETDARAWASTLHLAERHRLTLYNAAYLELSVRRDLPLASLDHALRGAAEEVGVEVL